MFKRNCKKVLSFTLASAMMITSLNLNGIHINAAEKENLALNKATTASFHYPADKFKPGKATDGKMDTRWSSENGDHASTNHWILVDLGEQKTFNQFFIASENFAGQNMAKFKIEGSNDAGATKNFTSIYESLDKGTEGFPFTQTLNLENSVTYQYVRLTVEKLIPNAYPSISIAEFQIFNVDQAAQDPNSNIAQGKTATVSSEETSAF
ncbi:MAG: discoidin domain-containing protein, partial [Longicatena sp.]